ncbi:hypothetical protein EAH85_17960 [Curtobacterium flaccumfaciens]|nr:hypothetical protein EAH85_17960 [Curtobacterium flaccumfaciens]
MIDQVRTDPWAARTAVLSVGDKYAGVAPVTVRDAVAAVEADATPGLLLMSAVPAGEDGRELARLLERPGGRWACISATPSSLARWNIEVRRDGTHVSDVLGTLHWAVLGLVEPSAPSDGGAAASASASDSVLALT